VLPDYADDGTGFPVFRGPYLQQDARLAVFLFNADMGRLAALCQQRLNVSSAFAYQYVPLTSSLMLVYADMLVSSRDERDAQAGLIPETEASFWVLTAAMKKTRGGAVPHHLAWFLPYLLVDEGSAIATGREVYGFPKLAAQFQKPDEIQRPAFRADVLGIKVFGAQAVAQRERLLTLSAPSAPGPAPASDLDSIKQRLAGELSRNMRAGLGSAPLEWAARFINDRIPLVFLKQFRDAQDTRKACYQKLVEAPLKVEAFYEGGLLPGGYSLQLAGLASHPLAQTLGLQAAGQTSTLGAWMRVDFALGNGVEI
jgi:hypothetical protein